jgi:hypothetical protein
MVFLTIFPPSLSNLIITTVLEKDKYIDNEKFGDGKKIENMLALFPLMLINRTYF